MSPCPLRIAVVGAGPAGLTLASILHHKAQQLDLPNDQLPWLVTLYEAEPSLEARRQGGSLDLGRATGLAAIAAAGLTDQFHRFARPEGHELKAMTPRGELLLHRDEPIKATSDLYSPEIDRADLNRVLVESLPAQSIRWGHKLARVRAREDDEGYELCFADGATALADLVVGADGAWSRVRGLVTSELPVYSGATFLDCTLRDFDARFPELVDLVGHGSLYAFEGGNVLVSQRNGYGVLRLYLGFETPENWASTSDVVRAETDRERGQLLLATRYADWHDSLKQLIAAASASGSPAMVARALYTLPLGHTWTHRRGVTLIGDAAHLMSPCEGEGVNMAMLDALRLAETIAASLAAENSGGDDNHAAALASVAQFEREMFARVAEPMQRSADNLALFVSPEQLTMERFARRFAAKVDLASLTP